MLFYVSGKSVKVQVPMADESELAAEIELPIDWHIPDNMVSRYATNMVIQHTEHEFVVSFFRDGPSVARRNTYQGTD